MSAPDEIPNAFVELRRALWPGPEAGFFDEWVAEDWQTEPGDCWRAATADALRRAEERLRAIAATYTWGIPGGGKDYYDRAADEIKAMAAEAARRET